MAGGALGQTSNPTPVYTWTTLAGRASLGSEDGPAAFARFNSPRGLARDFAGNIYVADTGNHTIRRISPAGQVVTLAGKAGEAGSANGNGPQARFNAPRDVAVDGVGNVFVTDTGNHTIRMIAPNGVVSTLAGEAGQAGRVDGAAGAARFDLPDQIAVDGSGGVYVVNGGIRKIASGQVTTLLESSPYTTGEGKVGTLWPTGYLAVTSDGRIYFSASVHIPHVDGIPDYYYSQRVMKRETDGSLAAVASADYSEQLPSLYSDYNGCRVGAMSLDRDGNLYVKVRYNSTYDDFYLLRLPPGGPGAWKSMSFVSAHLVPDDAPDILANGDWDIYYTRTSDETIVRSAPAETQVFAGTARVGQTLVDGPAASARFGSINGLALDAAGNLAIGDSRWFFSFGDTVGRAALRRFDASTGNVSTVHQTQQYYDPTVYPIDTGFDGLGNMLLLYQYVMTYIDQVTPSGVVPFLDPAQQLEIRHIATDSTGAIWAANLYGQIYRRNLSGEWSLVAGKKFGGANPVDGNGTNAAFGGFYALSLDRSGNAYVLDEYQSATVSQNQAYIRRITPGGSVTTVSGNLAQTRNTPHGPMTDYPSAMCINSQGEFFLVYLNRNSIYRLKSSGELLAIGGADGVDGSVDGNGDQARFYFPTEIKVDAQDNLYVVDAAATTIRKGILAGYLPQISTQPRSQGVSVGGTVSLTVVASGTPAPGYQWHFNGTTIPGATTSALSLSNARSTDAGDYTVVVSNELGTVTSSKATLTVDSATIPPPTPPAGGGGGSIEAWFGLALFVLVAIRSRRQYRQIE